MENSKEQESAARSATPDNKQAVLVAAGTILVMACYKRISLIFLIEEWRVKAFLVLNLLLLAIFLTSTRSSSGGQQEGIRNSEMKIEKKKKRRGPQCGLSSEREVRKRCYKLSESVSEGNEDVKVVTEANKLSKEELNKRAEAFIVMFRQQLISDARNMRSPSFKA